MLLSSAASRRKQLKPAKFGSVEEEAAPVVNTNNVDEEQLIVVDVVEPCSSANGIASPQDWKIAKTNTVSSEKNKSAIAKGTAFGPFRARELNRPTAKRQQFSVRDTSGKTRTFDVPNELSHQWLSQLTLTIEPKAANARLTFDGEAISVDVTSDVESVGRLKVYCAIAAASADDTADKRSRSSSADPTAQSAAPPAKKFMCESCRIASFNSIDNLKAHLTYYCSGRATTSPTEAAAGDKETPITTAPVRKIPTAADGQADPLLALKTTLDPTVCRWWPPIGKAIIGQHHFDGRVAEAVQFLRPKNLEPPLLPRLPLPPLQQAPSVMDNIRQCGAESPQQPNVILLPVAYSLAADAPRYTVIGPPQTILPVAVPKNAGPLGRAAVGALQLQRAWTNGSLEIAQRTVAINGSEQFCLPLWVRPPPLGQQPPPASKPPSRHSPPSEQQQLRKVVRRAASSMSPLDLRLLRESDTEPPPAKKRSLLERPHSSSASTSSPRASSAGVTKEKTPPPQHNHERPFICECGIAFSTCHTLNGHKQFYCKGKQQEQNDEKDAVIEEAKRQQKTPVQPTNQRTKRTSAPKLKTTNSSPPQILPKLQPNLSSQTFLNWVLEQPHSGLFRHLGPRVPILSAPTTETPSNRSSNDFLCQLCGYKGYSPRGMKNHMRSQHRDGAPPNAVQTPKATRQSDDGPTNDDSEPPSDDVISPPPMYTFNS